jgi:hypothetical protein
MENESRKFKACFNIFNVHNKLWLANLLHLYCYFISLNWSFWWIRDEKGVYKQRSVDVKDRSRNVCHCVLLKDGIGKRNGKNCSDWLKFYLEYDTLNKNTLYSIKTIEDIFTTIEIVLVLMSSLKKNYGHFILVRTLGW